MTLAFDLFWSFRSPYSYLATPRLIEISQRYDVDVRLRPVYPLAVRVDGFFKRQNPKGPMYTAGDCFRTAQMLGMGFGPPRPDPIVMNMATGEVPADQPYIRRLTHLGQAAVDAGRGLAFIGEVAPLIWSGEVDGWNTGDHLARATERAGLDLAVLERTAQTEADRIEAVIQESHKALDDSGHWGVPTMVFQGEPFFGQDRIDTLLWRMGQHGLSERSA